MELGIIGLGRKGTSMVRPVMKAGNWCVVYDEPDTRKAVVEDGAVGTASLEDLAHKTKKPRSMWLMASAAVVDSTLKILIPFIERDDVIIDGGNSYYHDDLRMGAAERFSSNGEADFADKVLPALRYQFSRHEEKTDDPNGDAR